MDNEEDVAELLQRPQQASFGMNGWTFERELLSSVVDAVNGMHATLIAVNSEDGQPPKVTPLPRPETAVDRIEDKRGEEIRKNLVAMMLPNGPQPLETSPEEAPEGPPETTEE